MGKTKIEFETKFLLEFCGALTSHMFLNGVEEGSKLYEDMEFFIKETLTKIGKDNKKEE